MGYKPAEELPKQIVYTDLPGLEVYATTPDMGELMDVADMKLDLNAPKAQQMFMFKMFASYVTSWNIDHPKPRKTKPADPNVPYEMPLGATAKDVVCARCGLAEDMPLPTTAEHMMCLRLTFILPVIFGWISGVSRVDPPRLPASNSGETKIQEEVMQQLAALQSPTPSFVQSWS